MGGQNVVDVPQLARIPGLTVQFLHGGALRLKDTKGMELEVLMPYCMQLCRKTSVGSKTCIAVQSQLSEVRQRVSVDAQEATPHPGPPQTGSIEHRRKGGTRLVPPALGTAFSQIVGFC